MKVGDKVYFNGMKTVESITDEGVLIIGFPYRIDESAILALPVKLKKGWTLEKIKTRITERNNGSICGIDNTCLYENKDNHCAIGCFLRPGPHMTFIGGVHKLLNQYPYLRDDLFTDDWAFLSLFQSSHDDAVNGNVHTAIFNFLDLFTYEETQ